MTMSPSAGAPRSPPSPSSSCGNASTSVGWSTPRYSRFNTWMYASSTSATLTSAGCGYPSIRSADITTSRMKLVSMETLCCRLVIQTSMHGFPGAGVVWLMKRSSYWDPTPSCGRGRVALVALLRAPLDEATQSEEDAVPRTAAAWNDQDRVVAGNGSDDIVPPHLIDRLRDDARAPGEGVDHHQALPGIDGDHVPGHGAAEAAKDVDGRRPIGKDVPGAAVPRRGLDQPEALDVPG